MVIEALVPSGSRFAIYFNDAPQSERLPVVPGEWHSYVFKVAPKITTLRLDPTEVPSTVTQIRSISFVRGKDATRKLDLSSLPSWVKYNADITYDRGTDIASIRATGAEQFAMSTVNVDLGWAPLAGIESAVVILWMCLLAGSVYFVLQTWESDWRTGVFWMVLALIAVKAAQLSLWLVPFLHLAPTAPDFAVGNPTYTDYSKNADIATVGAGLAFAFVVVLIGIVLRRWLWHEGAPRFDSYTVRVSRSDTLFIAVLVLIFALLSFPAFKGYYSGAFHATHVYAFDPQIAFMWQYMEHHGLLPDRDYSFPYTGLYNKFSPLQPDLLLNYFHNGAIFTTMALGIYILFGKRRMATAAVALPLLPFLEATGTVWPNASWRYLLSASVVVILGAAICVRRPVWFVYSGAWATYVLTQESPQMVYALPAVFFLVIAALLLERDSVARARLLRLIGMGMATFCGLTAIWLGSMAHEQRLREWWAYMSTLSIQADYFAIPYNFVPWFHRPVSIETFGYLLLILLFVTAGIQILGRPGKVAPSYLTPFALAITTTIMLQKDVLRPGIMGQILALPLLGLFMVLVQYPPAANLSTDSDRKAASVARLVRLGWTGFASAFIIVLFVVLEGAWSNLEHTYTSRMAVLPESLAYAFDHKHDWSEAAAAYFSPQNIVMEDESGDLAKAEYLKATAGAPGEIYALGDCAYWYALLGQQPPFYVMSFHQAPIGAQENTLHWLESHRPRYVIWEPAATKFDDVPNPVRVPLLYTYIAANYLPFTDVHTFSVLRRRNPGEAADPAFWSKTLGPTVDLGFLPALSHLTRRLTDHGSVAVSYLLVHVPQPVTGRAHQVSLRLGDTQVSVSFKEREKVMDYPIRLDRVAQVAAAEANGVAPEVIGANASEASIRRGYLRKDLLY